MKKPTLFLSWLLVVVVTVIVAITSLLTGQLRGPAKGELLKTDEEQIEEKLKRHEERLEAIEKEYAQKRQEIEEHYLREFSKLELWSKQVLSCLESEEKVAFAEFNQKVKHTVSEISGYKSTSGYTRTHGYMAPSGYITSHGNIESGGYSSTTEEKFVKGDPSGEYVSRMCSIADAKTKTLKELERHFKRLQKRRVSDLAELEKAKSLEKANLLSVIRSLKAKPTHGLVTGTLCGNENSSVIIDGKILEEGDTIHGVTIIKILKNKVKFEKNGQMWMQKTGEAPAPKW